MPCEFYTYRKRGDVLVDMCVLTGRMCFVENPDTDAGRALTINCTRRTWALEHGPKTPPNTPDGAMAGGGAVTTTPGDPFDRFLP